MIKYSYNWEYFSFQDGYDFEYYAYNECNSRNYKLWMLVWFHECRISGANQMYTARYWGVRYAGGAARNINLHGRDTRHQPRIPKFLLLRTSDFCTRVLVLGNLKIFLEEEREDKGVRRRLSFYQFHRLPQAGTAKHQTCFVSLPNSGGRTASLIAEARGTGMRD